MATALTAEEQQSLKQSIDSLDGNEGVDTTGLEGTLMKSILKLDSPEKMREAARRMNDLTACNAELQSACQRYNLLQEMNAGEMETADALAIIKKIERKKLRIMRFAQIKEGKLGTAEEKDVDARKKIVEKSDSFEKLRASDVLFLKKKWADLTGLLLVPEKDSFGKVSRDGLQEKDSFIVNFGGNDSLDQIIGAGDILPPTVSKVLVNGVEGERKHFPRPGYYTRDGQYLAIHDGDKIEIAKIGEVNPEFLAESSQADESWLREQRINDMADGDWKALSDLTEDKELEEKAKEQIRTRKELGIDRSDENTIDNGENLKWEALWRDEKFQARLAQVCDQLGVSVRDMRVVLFSESGLNPKVVNKVSGATGLIQFMPKTAIALGTTVSALRRMPSYEQLLYVMKYFMPYRGKLNSVQDLYLATFYPAALGKPDNFVMGSEGNGSASPERIARDNYGIAPGENYISVASFRRYVERKTRQYLL